MSGQYAASSVGKAGQFGERMKKFNYTMNHKADEAYMRKMCHEGWAATSLVEGVWTFEPCQPDEYVYRVCYLRGKSADDIDRLKRELAGKGVEFVSRYSFWAIFRSGHDFLVCRADAVRTGREIKRSHGLFLYSVLPGSPQMQRTSIRSRRLMSTDAEKIYSKSLRLSRRLLL